MGAGDPPPAERRARPGGAARRARAERSRSRTSGPNTPEAVEQLERRLRDEGGVGLVDGDGLARLVPDPATLQAATAELDEVLRDVPSAWFDALAAPVLEQCDITFRADAGTVAALVGKGAIDAAVLLPPVTVPQIRAAALAGVRMPQKTTYFAPKPRSGLVYRPLDELGRAYRGEQL